jgi:hypothetical protein
MNDLRALLRRAAKSGCTVRQAKSGHYRVTGPTGDTVTVAYSPRSRRLHKVRADLRRIGADP